MITGAQIREARRLLGWERRELALKSKVKLAALIRAESADGEPAGITTTQANVIRQALEKAGIEFTNGGQPGVKLRIQG